MFGFLFDVDHAVTGDFRNAETLGVLDFFEQNLGPARLPAEILNGGANAAFDDVIAKNYAKLVAIGEVPRQVQRLGDTAFTFLIGVVNVGQSEVFPVG